MNLILIQILQHRENDKMSQFWRKCGKIITDGTKFIRCDKSPCGYYAVFGIKQRALNCDTMQANDPCKWDNYVIVAEVKNGAIQINGICLNVDTKKGLCLHKKGKWNCYTQCDEWDQQTGECISEYQYCDCYQFKVYNLSGCYDDYTKFAEAFYGKCGVEADQNGNYPQIWRQWYGDYITTSDADRCLQEWQREFNKLYSLNYIINYNSYWQRWWWDCQTTFWSQSTDYWCSDTEDCWDSWIDRNQDNSCPDGTKQCSESYDDQEIGIGAECYEQSGATSGYSTITYRFTQDTDWEKSCCFESSGVSAVGDMNNAVIKAVTDPSIYYLNRANKKSCVNDSDLCVSFEYRSGCVDNWYGTRTGAKSNFYIYKLSVARNENTPPQAKGVRFIVKKTHIQENVGLGHKSKTEQTTPQIYDLFFQGEDKITDLATDVTYFGVLNYPQCNDQCGYAQDGGDWEIQPYVMFGWAGYQEWSQNNLYDEYKYELVADRYLTDADLTTD